MWSFVDVCNAQYIAFNIREYTVLLAHPYNEHSYVWYVQTRYTFIKKAIKFSGSKLQNVPITIAKKCQQIIKPKKICKISLSAWVYNVFNTYNLQALCVAFVIVCKLIMHHTMFPRLVRRTRISHAFTYSCSCLLLSFLFESLSKRVTLCDCLEVLNQL